MFHWTTKATRNWFSEWVYGALFRSAPSTIEIPNLRVPRYRLAPVDGFFKLLCHRQSSLLATRSFLSSPCTNFDPTDFCHLRRRFNWFFNLFVCNFWPERLKLFRFASIHLRPISDYDMLTEGRSARDLLRKKIAP